MGIVTGVRFAGNGSRIEAVGTAGANARSCEFCGPIAAVLARARALAMQLPHAGRALSTCTSADQAELTCVRRFDSAVTR